jgi:hypothetical protein
MSEAKVRLSAPSTTFNTSVRRVGSWRNHDLQLVMVNVCFWAVAKAH